MKHNCNILSVIFSDLDTKQHKNMASYMQLMKHLIKPFLLAFLVISIPSFAFSSSLQYPGNGMPGISKNKPISELNQEIIKALSGEPNIKSDDDTVYITDNKQSKSFVSRYTLPSDNFDLIVPVTVEKGEIQISFGNIKIVITSNQADIFQDSQLVLSQQVSSGNVELSRGYDPIGRNEIGETVWVNGRGDNVNLNNPKISIFVHPGTVGQLGPWQWVRGSM